MPLGVEFGSAMQPKYPVVSMPPSCGTTCCLLPLLRGFSEIRQVFELAKKHGAVIAGGYARFCASPRKYFICSQHNIPPGDIDIFAIDARPLVDELNKVGFCQVNETKFSITMRPPGIPFTAMPDKVLWGCDGYHVQIIKFGGLHEEAKDRWDMMCELPLRNQPIETLATNVIATFDFSVVKVAILGPETVLADTRFWQNEMDSRLVVDAFKSGPYLCGRLAKYRRRGYDFNVNHVIALYKERAQTQEQKDTIPRISEGIRLAYVQPEEVLQKGIISDSGSGIQFHSRTHSQLNY